MSKKTPTRANPQRPRAKPKKDSRGAPERAILARIAREARVDFDFWNTGTGWMIIDAATARSPAMKRLIAKRQVAMTEAIDYRMTLSDGRQYARLLPEGKRRLGGRADALTVLGWRTA